MSNRKLVSEYIYPTATGEVVHLTQRWDPKSFTQQRLYQGRRVNGLKAGWYELRGHEYYRIDEAPDDPSIAPNASAVWLDECQTVIYKLPEVILAKQTSKMICIPEGERDCDSLAALGLVATTNPMGAGKWRDHHSELLRGAGQVVIIPDRDEPGQKHAEAVAQSLHGKVSTIKLVPLPDRNGQPVKDASDWLAAGGTLGELQQLVEQAPVWVPAEPEVRNGPPRFVDDESLEPLVSKYGDPYFFDKTGVKGINERFFAGLYCTENLILYEVDEKQFYIYDAACGLWRQTTPAYIAEQLGQRMLQFGRTSGVPLLEAHISVRNLRSIVESIKGMAEHRNTFADQPPRVHAQNGMITFSEEGDVLFGGFAPDYYSRNQSPIAFDEYAQCPRFLSELIYPAMTADDADLLQRWFGLTLLGVNQPQRLLIIDGTAGGGKGTVVRIVYAIVGEQNCCQVRTDLLGERFEVNRFIGKTLLYGPDVAGDFMMHKAAKILKALVGGDPMTPEGKGSNGTPHLNGIFNVCVTCNSRLHVGLDCDTEAWRRRLLIIRYANPAPARKIPDFDKVLIAQEGPGILRWGLAGAVKLMQELRSHGDFVLSDAQRKRIDDLLDMSDSIRLFLQQQVGKADDKDLSVQELVERYVGYCYERSWEPLPTRKIEAQLKDTIVKLFQVHQCHGIKRDGRSVRGWRGLAFNAGGQS